MLQYITMISCVILRKITPGRTFQKIFSPKALIRGERLGSYTTASDEFVRLNLFFKELQPQKMEKGSCLYSLSPFQILFE